MADLKAWEAEKQRYELVELAPGFICYAIRASARGTEPFHRLCANCYNAGKKSPLQQHIRGSYYDQYKCHGCGEEIGIDKGSPPGRSSDEGGSAWGV